MCEVILIKFCKVNLTKQCKQLKYYHETHLKRQINLTKFD